jgi:hypothetical protein
MGEENNSLIGNFLGRFTAFRALNHKNFRLFFGGQGISIIGTWVQPNALTWLVFQLTNSAFLLEWWDSMVKFLF